MPPVTIPFAVLAAQASILSGVGVFALIQPHTYAKLIGNIHGDESEFDEMLVCTFGMLAISLSTTYFVCATHPSIHYNALRTNVLMRLIGTFFFWRVGSFGTAIYELTWAVVNAVTALMVGM